MAMGISTVTDHMTYAVGDKAMVRQLAGVGFDAMDLSFFTHYTYGEIVKNTRTGFLFRPWDEIEAYYRDLKQAADDAGIRFGQSHAPFPSWCADDAVDQTMREILPVTLDICGVLDCPYIIIHPCFSEWNGYKPTKEEEYEINIRFYSELIPHAKRNNVIICLENMFGHADENGKHPPAICSDPDEFNRYIDDLNKIAGETRFAACLDVGHTLLTGGDPAQMIRALGGNLRTLHLHDNNGISDQHTVPFTGKMDWDAICVALKETGYKGDFCFEVSLNAPVLQNMFGDDRYKSAELLYAIGRRLVKKHGL